MHTQIYMIHCARLAECNIFIDYISVKCINVCKCINVYQDRDMWKTERER